MLQNRHAVQCTTRPPAGGQKLSTAKLRNADLSALRFFPIQSRTVVSHWSETLSSPRLLQLQQKQFQQLCWSTDPCIILCAGTFRGKIFKTGEARRPATGCNSTTGGITEFWAFLFFRDRGGACLSCRTEEQYLSWEFVLSPPSQQGWCDEKYP